MQQAFPFSCDLCLSELIAEFTRYNLADAFCGKLGGACRVDWPCTAGRNVLPSSVPAASPGHPLGQRTGIPWPSPGAGGHSQGTHSWARGPPPCPGPPSSGPGDGARGWPPSPGGASPAPGDGAGTDDAGALDGQRCACQRRCVLHIWQQLCRLLLTAAKAAGAAGPAPAPSTPLPPAVAALTKRRRECHCRWQLRLFTCYRLRLPCLLVSAATGMQQHASKVAARPACQLVSAGVMGIWMRTPALT